MTRVGGRVFRGPPLPDLFTLGQLSVTPSVNYLLDDVMLANVFEMHASGQWASPEDTLSHDDQEANERALRDRQGEVLSKYRVASKMGKAAEIYVSTILSRQQSYTVCFLPNER